MRVVAGSARGRRLAAPPGRAVRPTADRVREAIFNTLVSLGAVQDARVVDLYAGTGALGIEALSRGAACAAFVEQDPRQVAWIEKNLLATGFDRGDSARVVRTDVEHHLRNVPDGAYDLVLVDPPYAFDDWEGFSASIEPTLGPGAVVVAESDREIALSGNWEITKVKRYGGTVVSIHVAKSPLSRHPGATP